MYLSIYSDREIAQRYFARRTKGPEMWADSDSWSLLPFKEKKPCKAFSCKRLQPPGHTLLIWAVSGGGEGMTAAFIAVPPAWEGRWAAVPSAMQAASDLPPPHKGAEVRAQRAPVQGRNAHRASMCVVPRASPPGQQSWLHHICLPAHFLHGRNSWEAKGCWWNTQQFRHVPAYPDLQSLTDQLWA